MADFNGGILFYDLTEKEITFVQNDMSNITDDYLIKVLNVIFNSNKPIYLKLKLKDQTADVTYIWEGFVNKGQVQSLDCLTLILHLSEVGSEFGTLTIYPDGDEFTVQSAYLIS